MSDDKSQSDAALGIRRGAYPELTWTAVIVGWVIGAIIAVSIAYAALILGFSIEGSELAAILGWGVLRGVLRRNSILENNINQTIASAVNGASSGIMFTVPALFILARTEGLESVDDFTLPTTLLLILASITGCILGLAFVIPLRKQMIDFDRLAYPGGIAVAAILKSPGAGIRKAILLLGGAIVSGAVQLVIILKMGDHAQWHLGEQLQLPTMLNITFFLSVMTIGVGFLSGKGGFWFGAGGFICYWILSPLLSAYGAEPVQNLVPDPGQMRVELYRPTGIGMLIGAALGGIIAAFPLIRSALKSMQSASKQSEDDALVRNDEMSIKLLYVAVVIGAVALICIAFLSSDEMSLGRAILMALLGTAWVWVAGIIVAECIGRTNWSPLSGMTLIAVTIVILIAKDGMSAPAAVLSSMIVGTAICLAVSQASDMMLDLKSGYLVGAIPRRQQIAQYMGAWLGPCIVIMLMLLLNAEGEGIGGTKFPAPQATVLATMVDGIMNENVPAYRYVAGSGIGFLLAMSGLGGIGVLVGLGFYMPFDIVLTYTLGNTLRIFVDSTLGKKFSHEIGIPIAAGLIVGEALVNVGHALYGVVTAGGAG